MRTTYMAKPSDVTSQWWVIDGSGLPLGRVASEVAILLRGKHKPIFTPHLDTGDHVIIINAEKIVLTGNKLQTKMYYRHSGYPGGFKQTDYGTLMQTRPEKAMEMAVRGMLPHTRLGRAMMKKVRICRGSEHGHQAQKPEAWTVRD